MAQEAERQKARETERISQQNYSNTLESERQRELEQKQQWDRMSADTGEQWMYDQARANRRMGPGEGDTFGLIQAPGETDENFWRRVHMTRTSHKCYDNQTDTILDWDECEERERKHRERERREALGPDGRFAEDCANGTLPPEQCNNTVDQETMDNIGTIMDEFALYMGGMTDESHLGWGSPGADWRVT